jgi:MYXO-CTERM domain-containing protein
MGTIIRIRKHQILWGVGAGLVLLVGCGEPSSSTSGNVIHERVSRGPVAPRRYVTSEQPAIALLDSLPSLVPSPPMPDTSVDARLLVITAEGSDPGYNAIVESLRFLGTPFDIFNAAVEPDLTADRLATGNHGHYYGVILDRGNLSTAAGPSAFSTAEWMVLTSYEAQFQIRRVALYAYPEATYGLADVGSFDTTTTPLSVHCTDSGAAIFSSANCGAGIAVHNAWAYPATVTGATTTPILVDDAGRVFGVTSTDGSTYDYLALTFAQAPSLVHSLALTYDMVRWVTRGVFLGERHVYLSSQIDDLFLASDIYPFCSDCNVPGVDGGLATAAPTSLADAGNSDGGTTELTYRITDPDLQALADWQAGQRAQPLSAELRLDWALNGGGTGAADPLTLRAQALGPAFTWISHTWDHASLDTLSYTNTLAELTKNNALVSSMGFQPYDVRNLVTPSISGLNNPEALRAIFDAGVRFLVGDTSVTGWANPSPNAGIYSQDQPAILVIPRRPTNLFYNVSTPDKWQQEYNAIYNSYWGRDLSYDEILDFEANVLLQHLLRGENDPWMFHQANTRDYGGGHSLLSDLHDRVLAKYVAISKLPIVSPTMDALGGRVASRMTYDQAQAAAVIGPGAQITVSVVNGAFVPVTGLCTPTAETYAGQKISYVALAAGGAATFSLAGCNDGGGGADGGAGTGGAPGTGGATGAGGTNGTGGDLGAGGAVGMVGTGGMLGTGGDLGVGGSIVTMGMGGETGAGGATGAGGEIGAGGTLGAGGEIGAGGTLGAGGEIGAGGTLGTGGAVATGGDSGSGGAGDTGGATGAGGAVASGGDSGAIDAGVVTGMGGAKGMVADAGLISIDAPSSGGCSCSVGDRSPTAGTFGLVLAMGTLVTRRRRRARVAATAAVPREEA